ncbi:MAG: glycerol kinase GlpK [Gemmatimonadota bacterium]
MRRTRGAGLSALRLIVSHPKTSEPQGISMTFILALDQGTTSSRAIVFDREGGIAAVAQKEFEQIFPRPGWVEHDPREIWSSQMGVAAEALSQAGITSKEVAAIGITNQRETTVVWERKSGKPIHNAIVWQDRRTAELCDRLRSEGHEPVFRDKTGLVLDAYFSGTKVRWILDEVSGAREKAERGELCFGTIDSWLIWNLTKGGLHVTDATNASRTLLYNIHTGEWDDELLGTLQVPRSLLPEVRASSEVYGETARGVFPDPIPVSGVAGDQQAALFGQRCTQPGMVKNTYGTGCFMLLNTGTEAVPSKNNLLTTVAWKVAGTTEYALEGSVFIAGAVVQWLRDGLKLIRSASEVEELSRTVQDNGGIYMVPAFAGLGAPHWDPYARGTIVGITRGTTGGHFARAALESIAYQVADVLEAMQADSGIDIRELRVDGGAAQNNLLMQFQADLLQVPIVRPEVFETTALGAAYLAGLAVGYWKDEEEISSQWKANRRFNPEMRSDAVAALRAGWRKALDRAKAWDR